VTQSNSLPDDCPAQGDHVWTKARAQGIYSIDRFGIISRRSLLWPPGHCSISRLHPAWRASQNQMLMTHFWPELLRYSNHYAIRKNAIRVLRSQSA
jgi:hypothetical protein